MARISRSWSAFKLAIVLALDEDLAGARFDQPVEQADQRGLAAARQSHDAEDLSAADLETGIGDADDAAEVLQDLCLAEPRSSDGLHRRRCGFPEDLPDRLAVDQDIVGHSLRCSYPYSVAPVFLAVLTGRTGVAGGAAAKMLSSS